MKPSPLLESLWLEPSRKMYYMAAVGSTLLLQEFGSGGDKTEGGCAGKVALHGGGIKIVGFG